MQNTLHRLTICTSLHTKVHSNLITSSGFGDDLKIHREFVTYVKSQLSEWMAPPNWNATCGQLWALNKTLIISYNKDNVVDQYPDLLWRGVQHKWGNVQKLKDLRKYLTEVFSRLINI